MFDTESSVANTAGMVAAQQGEVKQTKHEHGRSGSRIYHISSWDLSDTSTNFTVRNVLSLFTQAYSQYILSMCSSQLHTPCRIWNIAYKMQSTGQEHIRLETRDPLDRNNIDLSNKICGILLLFISHSGGNGESG